jgi:hypothetical protein
MSHSNNLLSEDKPKNTGSVLGALKKYKDLAISEVKETRLLVKILISTTKDYLKNKDFDLNQEEKNFIKDQSSDILKLIPLIVFQLVPGSSIATPFIVKLGQKLGIKLTSKVPEKYKEVKTDGEIDELVSSDGSPIGSNVPILKLSHHPRKTTDQTARMSRVSQYPFARIYYGESEENKPVIDEEDITGTFGSEETEYDKTYSECMKSMEDLGVEDFLERDERCKVFGFDKKLDLELKQEKKQGRCKNCYTKRRLFELEKDKLDTLIDEIVLSKKSDSEDIVKKEKLKSDDETPIYRIIKKNLQSIKAIADKEDINLNKLIQILKKGE